MESWCKSSRQKRAEIEPDTNIRSFSRSRQPVEKRYGFVLTADEPRFSHRDFHAICKWHFPKHNAIMTAQITIDSAGRVVIPKPLRDVLDLAPGDMLDLEATSQSITLRPARVAVQKRVGSETRGVTSQQTTKELTRRIILGIDD